MAPYVARLSRPCRSCPAIRALDGCVEKRCRPSWPKLRPRRDQGIQARNSRYRTIVARRPVETLPPLGRTLSAFYPCLVSTAQSKDPSVSAPCSYVEEGVLSGCQRLRTAAQHCIRLSSLAFPKRTNVLHVSQGVLRTGRPVLMWPAPILPIRPEVLAMVGAGVDMSSRMRSIRSVLVNQLVNMRTGRRRKRKSAGTTIPISTSRSSYFPTSTR